MRSISGINLSFCFLSMVPAIFYHVCISYNQEPQGGATAQGHTEEKKKNETCVGATRALLL